MWGRGSGYGSDGGSVSIVKGLQLVGSAWVLVWEAVASLGLGVLRV